MRRLVIAALFVSAPGCALWQSWQSSPAPAKAVAVESPAERTSREAEDRAVTEEQRLTDRQAQLEQLVIDTNLLDMPEPQRQQIRASTLSDLAQIRFERRDDRSIEAIDRAYEAALESGDAPISQRILRQRYLLYRFVGFELAKGQKYDESLRLLDRLARTPELSPSQRNQVGGDRLLVMEMQGDLRPGAKEALAASLAALIGPVEKPERPKLPELPDFTGPDDTSEVPTPTEGYVDQNPEAPKTRGDQVDADALRREIALEMAKQEKLGKNDVAEAELPSNSEGAIAETGTIDQRVVLEVVSANKKSISACYTQAMRSGQGFRGRLEVLVTVKPSGEVASTTIETASFKGKPVAKCISETVQRWRFPPFKDEIDRQVLLPFLLDYFY